MAHVQHQQALHLLDSDMPFKIDDLRSVAKPSAPPKRHGSLQPQENDLDDDDVYNARIEPTAKVMPWSDTALPTTQQSKPAQRSESQATESAAPSLVASLETICSLTKRITLHETAATSGLFSLRRAPRSAEAFDLAALHCQRATTLLQYVKFDANARIPLSLLETVDDAMASSHQSVGDGGHGRELDAVQQALDDAMAAISLDSRGVNGYILAAQCSRSLGRSANAMDYIVHALQIDSHNRTALQLMRELRVDLDELRFAYAPPWLCSSSSTNGVDDDDEQQQHDTDDGPDASASLDAKAVDLVARFKTMECLALSPLLLSLEQMMHASIHHQCASVAETKALAIAFDQTVDLLRLLLSDAANTSQAILVEAHELASMADLIKCSQSLSQTPSIRKWIVKTLVPAVMQSLPDADDAFFPRKVAASSRLDCRPAMLRDVLLVIARLLLVSGSIQRCTMMQHTLGSIKMAYDLAKQLGMDTTYTSRRSRRSNSQMHRFEMVCADAYAVALLELTEEAGETLLLHQESLEAAINAKDLARELQCHHLLGRALLKLREFAVAHSEFEELLIRSQAQNDTVMECIAWYHLGEIQLALGSVDEAMAHFDKALLLCNQSGQCHGAWRLQSVENAIAFYACLRPIRRHGISRGLASQINPTVQVPASPPTRSAVVMPALDHGEQEDDAWSWADEEEEEKQPARRRATVWLTSSALAAPPKKTTANTSVPRGLSLMGRLISQTPSRSSMSSPTRPECWKPRA